MYTSKDIFRDALLFSVLAFLIICASHRLQTFIALHKNSLIHELDQGFADQLYAAHKQLRTVINLIEQGYLDDSSLERVQKIQKNLDSIEEKYTKNSPGVLFLGPIGTASIVLKEQQLYQKLLEQINEVGKILYELAAAQNIHHIAHKGARTIPVGLELNKALLTALRQTKNAPKTPSNLPAHSS